MQACMYLDSAISLNQSEAFETIIDFIQGVSKYFLKHGGHCIDDFQSIRFCASYEYVLRKSFACPVS